MKKICILLFIITASCCLEDSRTSSDITVMSWNLQNLFDAEDNGQEYSDFSVSDGAWSQELYEKRLQNISKIISLNKPDIIALQEIEGVSVLSDLQKNYLEDYEYFVANNDDGAIELGFMSKFPIIKVGKIRPDSSEYGIRSLLEIHVDIHGHTLVFINNHWKSKLGDFTEPLRINSSVALKKRLEELNDLEVVALGDFNENYDEFKRIGKSYDTALMYNENGEGITITDSSRLENYELFTPWPDSNEQGSYSYKGNWETIDHFLLNKKLVDKDDYYFDDFYVDKRSQLFNSKGDINKWYTDFATGYSDHLPIILKLGIDSLEITLE